jgi:hypothetical protein
MGDYFDLFLLLALAAAIGLWLKLSLARETAIAEVRRQCDQHGLQLLDETVGLRGIRLRQHHGARVLERCYGFEVSVDGEDRQPARIWMNADGPSGVSLPPGAITTAGSSVEATTSNVIPLHRRNHSTLH